MRLLDEHGTHLRNIDGVGPVLAARILGRNGRASRFPTAAAYANYTGTAPSRSPAPMPLITDCRDSAIGN
jgi:transposase